LNAAVILAAGSSSRMGFPKQLAEVKDKPLLQAIIDKVNINFDNSSVVLGSENEIISEKIDYKNSNILINEYWPEGITSSIRTALFFYQNQKEINNIIFFLGDQPEVEVEVIDGLNNDDHDGSKVLVPQYRYKLGFPILIPRIFWTKLELITEDDEVDEEKSVFQDFDLVDFLISSEIEIKKLNFNFLEPIDYDEEKDF
jgi:molybdenum cofactor cytidylyltransferase